MGRVGFRYRYTGLAAVAVLEYAVGDPFWTINKIFNDFKAPDHDVIADKGSIVSLARFYVADGAIAVIAICDADRDLPYVSAVLNFAACFCFYRGFIK